ncbi:Chemotaxis protein methyltransferase CheR [hydrothermal vent metagenome]|uniref:protein-glutamate O-methyltransferase n=1 Tax=hydrothermal vent metagenome TaxID=652676 RepID=A0A3B0XP35_9ZZZZ
MLQFKITDGEFNSFRSFIYDHAGITLSDEKKNLVTSRLSKRLRHYSFNTFQEYFDLITVSPQDGERQTAIDLLTTNETYFFREPKHFDFLKKEVLAKLKKRKNFRIWSAASSTGEEAYSIAMLLDDMLGTNPWEIFASDISSRVLKKARHGHYLQNRIDGIPKAFLHKYCLKGVGDHQGTLLIDKSLRKKVIFESINLKMPLGNVGFFDVIFLRNVLIYFDMETKKHIIKQLVEKLQPGGYLFIGHSESLKGVHDGLESIIPAVYRKI